MPSRTRSSHINMTCRIDPGLAFPRRAYLTCHIQPAPAHLTFLAALRHLRPCPRDYPHQSRSFLPSTTCHPDSIRFCPSQLGPIPARLTNRADINPTYLTHHAGSRRTWPYDTPQRAGSRHAFTSPSCATLHLGPRQTTPRDVPYPACSCPLPPGEVGLIVRITSHQYAPRTP